jgi:hypothetical protein
MTDLETIRAYCEEMVALIRKIPSNSVNRDDRARGALLAVIDLCDSLAPKKTEEQEPKKI